MKAGPKAAVDGSPLPFECDETGSARFAAFCEQFIVTPKGTGAREPMVPRLWQRDLVGSVLDADPKPRTAGWMLPRGSGKSTLLAALGLYDLLLGVEGASVVVAAVDERQAQIIFRTAARMVELNEDLASRVQVFASRLYVPERGASFQSLPASPKALEGLDPTMALLDEAGVIDRDVYEVIQLAQGKRAESVLIAIGTPGPDPHNSVLTDLRDYAAAHPEDDTLVWREFSAAGFEHHPVDCEHCLKLANPGWGDLVHPDAVRALLPPKTREATFRRARLCQFVTDTSGKFLAPGVWDGLSTGEAIPEGSKVVLALDGSFRDDTTSCLLATVDKVPHFDVLGVWEKPEGDDDWRVPVVEVEDAIRVAARTWQVVEVVADPFRWTRTLQVLQAEGLPISEFPHSPQRLTAATGDLLNACNNKGLTHSGDTRLAEHVAAAVLVEDSRGVRLDKGSRSRIAHKIDLAACLVMAYSRATWRARTKPRGSRVYSFKR